MEPVDTLQQTNINMKKRKKYCEFCHKHIKQKEKEQDGNYAKRKYHTECKVKGMRKNQTGFYNPMSWPIPIAHVVYVKGHLNPDNMRIIDM